MSSPPVRPSDPFWVDEFDGKHEAFTYGESRSRTEVFIHEGKTLRLILPEYAPPFSVRTVGFGHDLAFLIGERLDEEDEDGEVVEAEGYGVVIVACKHPRQEETYWALVRHEIFPETLERIGASEANGDGSGQHRAH